MIELFNVFMSENIDKPLLDIIHSGYLTQGTKVKQFEDDFAKFVDHPYVLALNSATSGLQLATYMSGATDGSWVISTPMTCAATNTAILSTGAGIIWADIDPITGNIDPNSVEDILKAARGSYSGLVMREVKAIMCVDWGGNPCDLEGLRYLADKYGLKLIRDAAHSLGSRYKKQQVGPWCDYTVFSFQAIKHLTTADGGAILCNNAEDHKRAELLRWYGVDRESPRGDMRCEEDIEEAGFKYHMNNVNATIGIENLKYMPMVTNRHKLNGSFYDLQFFDTHVISSTSKTWTKDDRESAYWIYTILVSNRDSLIRSLANHGIMSSKVHARVDRHTAFSSFRKDLPGTDKFSEHQLNIPVGWWVTLEQRMYIVETVLKLAEGPL